MNETKKILYTLTLAAILITALSFVLPKNEVKYLGDRFWAKKTFSPAIYDIIIIGDSRTYRGVSPTIMSQYLPEKKILNFAYSNGGLNKVVFAEAEKKLSKSNSKKVIIIGITANTLSGFTRSNEQLMNEKTRPREDVLERIYLNGILNHFSSVTPEQVVGLIKNKPDTKYYRSKYYYDGYVESDKFPKDTMEAIPLYYDDFTKYKVDNQYIEELINQVGEWDEKGIMVVGYCPPVSSPMKELEKTMGLFDYELIKSEFIKNGGKWIDLNSNEYKTYDGSHLEKESAEKLSKVIGEYIKKTSDL